MQSAVRIGGQTLSATLSLDIHFNKENRWITIKKGTPITVDTELGIAFHNNDHFQIFEEEYTPIYQN